MLAESDGAANRTNAENKKNSLKPESSNEFHLAEKERFEFREVDFNPSYPFYMFVQLRFGLDSVNLLWRNKP